MGAGSEFLKGLAAGLQKQIPEIARGIERRTERQERDKKFQQQMSMAIQKDITDIAQLATNPYGGFDEKMFITLVKAKGYPSKFTKPFIDAGNDRNKILEEERIKKEKEEAARLKREREESKSSSLVPSFPSFMQGLTPEGQQKAQQAKQQREMEIQNLANVDVMGGNVPDTITSPPSPVQRGIAPEEEQALEKQLIRQGQGGLLPPEKRSALEPGVAEENTLERLLKTLGAGFILR